MAWRTPRSQTHNSKRKAPDEWCSIKFVLGRRRTMFFTKKSPRPNTGAVREICRIFEIASHLRATRSHDTWNHVAYRVNVVLSFPPPLFFCATCRCAALVTFSSIWVTSRRRVSRRTPSIAVPPQSRKRHYHERASPIRAERGSGLNPGLQPSCGVTSRS